VLGVGVDRMDYTKGILERFLALERHLTYRILSTMLSHDG